MDPKLEIIITTPDGERHVCEPPQWQESEDGEPRQATEKELVTVLIRQTLAKPQPCGFALKSGGSLILGPMTAARSQFLVAEVKNGPIAIKDADGETPGYSYYHCDSRLGGDRCELVDGHPGPHRLGSQGWTTGEAD